jgi:hypothetical protein
MSASAGRKLLLDHAATQRGKVRLGGITLVEPEE